jgi:hypothetical protein
MLTNEDTVIELHSVLCRCHGYGWNARRNRLAVRTPCCREDELVPPGALWIDAAEWLALGMPRNVQQYQSALAEQSQSVAVA